MPDAIKEGPVASNDELGEFLRSSQAVWEMWISESSVHLKVNDEWSSTSGK